MVHPNPFSEETILTVKGIENVSLEFTVFDVQGRELRRETHRQNSFKFLQQELKEGLYFYRIEIEGKRIATGKIVVR